MAGFPQKLIRERAARSGTGFLFYRAFIMDREMAVMSNAANRTRAGIHSLRFQIIAIMLLCYLVPVLLLGFFTRSVLLTAMRKRTEAALAAGVEHAWTLTAQNIERAVGLSRDAIYDGELAGAYEQWAAGGIADAEYLRLSRGYIERKYSRDGLFTFAACFPAERPELFMYTRSGYDAAMVFLSSGQDEILRISEEIDTSGRFVLRDGRLYLVRNLVSLKMERYAVLVLGMNRDVLFSPLLGLAETWDGRVSLRLDGNECGEAPESPDQAASGAGGNGRELRYERRSESDDYDLELLLSLDERAQFREDYEFRILASAVYLLLIPVLGLLAWYVSRRIVRPITLLSKASRRIENGELGVTVPMKGQDELGDLGRAFSRMSRRIEELIDKTYKEEIALRDARIQALQSRINPHFINNALEDINWTARMEGSENISSMVTSLSVLLNATMAREDRRLVTLREEMEVAEAYIYFIEQRFGTDLTVNREIDEKAMDGILPLLTIQPLLENAVEHGIAPAGGGVITIRCSLNDACMHVEIINTGRETGKEDRERIEAALHGQPTGRHLGLANIVNRLRLIYGESVSIRVDTDTPGQTTVSIVIPREIH